METPSQRKRRIRDEKDVQYYMALVTAWINTKMEHDKTIITISAAAIGLLITILTNKGVAASWHILLFAVSFLGYMAAIIIATIILKENSTRIEQEIRNLKINDDIKLEKLDQIVKYSFIVGTVFFVLIGIFSALAKSNEKDPKKYQETQIKVVCYCNHTSEKFLPKAAKTKTHNYCRQLLTNCLQESKYSSCRER